MLRFQRNSGFKLLFWWAFQPRRRFFNFHVCLLSFPLWFGLFQIVLFVRLLSWTHIWHISLKSLCIRPIWHRIQETWKKTPILLPWLAQISNVTSFFIQALQNATFAVKNTAVSQKLSKLAIVHLFSRDFFFLSFPVFERYDTNSIFSISSSSIWSAAITLFFIQVRLFKTQLLV